MSRARLLLAGLVLLVLAALVVPTRAASPLTFQLLKSGAPLTGASVVLYFSYGPEIATSDAQGMVTVTPGKGRGFWVEVNGQRLARFFTLDNPPTTIDVTVVGTMPWPTGR